MTRILILAAGGLILFGAGLIGTLSIRGKLNAESLKEVLGSAGQASESPDDLGSERGEGGAGNPGDGPAEGAAGANRKVDPAASPLAIPSPFSEEETRALFDELRRARQELLEARAYTDKERRDLELVRIELNRRWDEVTQKEQELQEYARSLEAQRFDLEQRTVLLKEAETDNLQQLARNVEKMPADAAARMLQENEPERVALILHFVKPREAGKIMGAMPEEFAATVAEKMLGILKTGSRTNDGGP